MGIAACVRSIDGCFTLLWLDDIFLGCRGAYRVTCNLAACHSNKTTAEKACRRNAPSTGFPGCGNGTVTAAASQCAADRARSGANGAHGDHRLREHGAAGTQSPDIAGAVDGDTLGAGDQGIMYGYACWETVELLPAPIVLANRITSLLTTCREEKLISGIGPDGKAQVSVQYAFGVPERVDTIVISCQHDADKDPTELREELRRLVIARACHDVRIDEQTKILINPSGRFVLGGFEVDTGLTGRKLMVDTYGGLAPHGGGALSGKDGTKVDRSGAYMARYVAKNIVAAGLADVCTVSLAYAIGQTEPVAVEIDTQESGYYDDAFLTEAVRRVFDFTLTGMIRALDLDKPFFAEVCNNCHFMPPQAAWEQTDKAEKLRMACAELEDERT